MTQTLPPRRDEHAGQFRYPPPRRPAPYNPQYRPQIPPPHPVAPAPAQKDHQTAIMWSVVGAVLALVALAITLVLATTPDRATETTPSTRLVPAGGFITPAPTPTTAPRDEAENALQHLVQDFIAAANRGPTSNWMDYYCAADRAVIIRNSDGDVIVPTKGFNARTKLTGVEVHGTRASGYLDGEDAQFLKESDHWTFCLTG
jgi:hypothetical protein